MRLERLLHRVWPAARAFMQTTMVPRSAYRASLDITINTLAVSRVQSATAAHSRRFKTHLPALLVKSARTRRPQVRDAFKVFVYFSLSSFENFYRSSFLII